MPARLSIRFPLALTLAALAGAGPALAQRTEKPVLHGRHWVAITGKPLGGDRRRDDLPEGRQRRGRRLRDARGDGCTMWDTLCWGGETQALIYNPHTEEGRSAINALGVAPTGATAAVLPGQGVAVSARVRSARRRHARARRGDS